MYTLVLVVQENVVVIISIFDMCYTQSKPRGAAYVLGEGYECVDYE